MLVSVIVPVYNAEKYLRRCIDSVLSQTFKDFELILVDDGSKDNCPGICDEYALKDARIRVIHQDNQGVSAARNAGLDAIKGDYVMFVDADDYVRREYIAGLLDAVIKNPAVDLVVEGITFDCGELVEENSIKEEIVCTLKEFKEQFDFFYKLHLVNSVCAKFYKRNLLFGLRFDNDVPMGEDLLFNLSYYSKCSRIMFTPSLGYIYYAINSSSAMHTFKDTYVPCQKLLYVQTKMFLYGDARFSNDYTDCVYCFATINLTREICGGNDRRRMKKEKIVALLNEPYFMEVVKGDYSCSKLERVAQFLSRRKACFFLCLYFRVRNIAGKLKRALKRERRCSAA